MDREESYKRLLEARRMLDEFGKDCEILVDLQILDDKWLIVLSLKNRGKVSKRVPLFTSWHVVIDQEYPKGEIYFYPSKEKGITDIYPHQSAHSHIDGKDYYDSNICLEQYSPTLKNELNNDFRLYSYVSKALEWIEAASNNSLLEKGDPFEIVSYPVNNYKKQILFNEDRESFKSWEKIESNTGFCNIKLGSASARQDKSLFYITDFYEGQNSYKNHNDLVLSNKWGDYITKEQSGERKGIWIKLKKMPLIEPWRAPSTWKDLIKILKIDGIDFDKEIVPLLNKLRNGQNHFMIIGFPIPKIVGNDNVEFFWQGINLPILSYHKTNIKYFNGFRRNIRGYQYVDKKILFNSRTNIEWVNSENWSTENVVSRGSLPKTMKQLKYLVVGVGSVGSRITEAMVRMGVNKIDLVDSDIVLMGNLTRHSLLATDLYYYKAEKMLEKLSKSNIHFIGQAFPGSIEKYVQKHPEKIQDYDVIIETTGEDKILDYLENLSINTKVYSISIGVDAKRLYIGSISSNDNSFSSYLSMIKPWLEKDVDEYVGLFPRDGVGCWHPLFPARLDHVNILCNTAINIIEKDIIDEKDYNTIIEREELGTTRIIIRDEVS